MGLICSRSDFVVNSKVSGQSYRVLEVAFELGLNRWDIDKLFRHFKKMDVYRKGAFNIREFVIVNKISCESCGEYIFRVLDKCDMGNVTFEKYLIAMWNILSLDDDDLASFSFNLFDVHKAGFLTNADIKKAVDSAWGDNAKGNTRILQALRRLDQNGDGEITPEEFLHMVKEVPVLLFPVFEMRNILRHNSLGESRWRKLAQNRRAKYSKKTLNDILQAWSNHTNRSLQNIALGIDDDADNADDDNVVVVPLSSRNLQKYASKDGKSLRQSNVELGEMDDELQPFSNDIRPKPLVLKNHRKTSNATTSTDRRSSFSSTTGAEPTASATTATTADANNTANNRRRSSQLLGVPITTIALLTLPTNAPVSSSRREDNSSISYRRASTRPGTPEPGSVGVGPKIKIHPGPKTPGEGTPVNSTSGAMRRKSAGNVVYISTANTTDTNASGNASGNGNGNALSNATNPLGGRSFRRGSMPLDAASTASAAATRVSSTSEAPSSHSPTPRTPVSILTGATAGNMTNRTDTHTNMDDNKSVTSTGRRSSRGSIGAQNIPSTLSSAAAANSNGNNSHKSVTKNHLRSPFTFDILDALKMHTTSHTTSNASGTASGAGAVAATPRSQRLVANGNNLRSPSPMKTPTAISVRRAGNSSGTHSGGTHNHIGDAGKYGGTGLLGLSGGNAASAAASGGGGEVTMRRRATASGELSRPSIRTTASTNGNSSASTGTSTGTGSNDPMHSPNKRHSIDNAEVSTRRGAVGR